MSQSQNHALMPLELCHVSKLLFIELAGIKGTGHHISLQALRMLDPSGTTVMIMLRQIRSSLLSLICTSPQRAASYRGDLRLSPSFFCTQFLLAKHNNAPSTIDSGFFTVSHRGSILIQDCRKKRCFD